MNKTEDMKGKKRVLVVDDDKSMGDTIKRLLEYTNHYSVRTVQGGETAINLLKQQTFDLLITDYGMPKMNGYELFKRCKDLKPGLPVMFITGSKSHEEIIEKAKSEGVRGCVYKPFDIDEMIAIVNTCAGTGEKNPSRAKK